MNSEFYKTATLNTSHSTFGGKISNYDFDGYVSMSNMASRIASDLKFDKQCRANINNRKMRKDGASLSANLV